MAEEGMEGGRAREGRRRRGWSSLIHWSSNQRREETSMTGEEAVEGEDMEEDARRAKRERMRALRRGEVTGLSKRERRRGRAWRRWKRERSGA